MFKGVCGHDMKARLAARPDARGRRVHHGREAFVETLTMIQAAFKHVRRRSDPALQSAVARRDAE
jgi:hypothetical protein